MALGKLKEAMEEPQQKSMAFINNMHSQLKELNRTSFHDQPTSSHSKFQTDSSI
ncbi:homeobox protein knotted-1-like 1 [Senna tora]|uniref:Homeobox protein knotted-1-like 1 n=1 Tax=Senna tora TaxID=362788 RepID=A0A834TI21_9FABA|nr:homeobox protein knotted-1-like 1 [Senna tora]